MFIKKQENFKCERCGVVVEGDGYTNHCPACLWSKHVDVEPGDRAAECGGLMRPVEYEAAGGGFDLIHECVACGHRKRNKVAPDDDLARLVAL